MMKLAFALILVTACTTKPPIHAPTPFELEPINHSGEMAKSIRAGKQSIQVGLATRGKQTSVVRIDGKQLTELFAVPASVPGVPTTAFDFMIDPEPIAEEPVPGEFRLVGSTNNGTTIYTVTWVMTWNGVAFDVAEPQITRRAVGGCEVCDETT